METEKDLEMEKDWARATGSERGWGWAKERDSETERDWERGWVMAKESAPDPSA